MKLSDVFTAVAHKRLVQVDLPHAGSNQHELNGVAALRGLFGVCGKTEGEISWHYFADDEDPIREQNRFTFYDARAKGADRHGRSEWRFYYVGNFLAHSSIGDLLVFARAIDGRCYGLIFQWGSAWCRAAKEIFELHEMHEKLDAMPRRVLERQRTEFLCRQIVAELNLELVLPVAPNDEKLVVEKFGRSFPSTREMSVFAQEQVHDVDVRKPDETLVRWLEREEQLFRALEGVLIRERLETRFGSVDEFLEYSLSVQNRRKSRMGFALQNHLARLFMLNGLRFTPQARTEARSRPDFIFPGEAEYRDKEFSARLLVMLGVKSTSKDRWRQVLTEADRIKTKHLCTLEAGISTRQTDEMRRQSLKLVVPTGLHATYTDKQKSQMFSIYEFVEFVRRKQAG